MFRVVIYGSSGSGKSRLARALADRLNVPHVEIDELAYDRDGHHIPLELLADRFQKALGDGGWVVEGMHRDELRSIIPKADTLVWLDLSRSAVAWQLTTRTLRHWMARTPRHGRRVTTRTLWSRELPFVVKSIRSHPRRRSHGHDLSRLAQECDATVVHLRSRFDATMLARRE